jgi:hypothetical protein
LFVGLQQVKIRWQRLMVNHKKAAIASFDISVYSCGGTIKDPGFTQPLAVIRKTLG